MLNISEIKVAAKVCETLRELRAGKHFEDAEMYNILKIVKNLFDKRVKSEPSACNNSAAVTSSADVINSADVATRPRQAI